MADVLTPAQSAQRIAELRAQGYIVTTRTLADGTVVVSKSRPGQMALGLALVAVGLLGCFAYAKR